ncbi:MAG: 50S ribosomal protein L24 [Planctomycetaceae bacterium]|nr:50S ribosomal protein L24 [Planctomycetaceae bacterium]
MRIKVGDNVKLLLGDDRDQEGRVTKINHATRTVVVEGMNRVNKMVRKSQKNPQGGQLKTEMPIPISNVQFVCPSCNRATRLGASFKDDKSKVRQCKKKDCSWEEEISPAKSS